MWCNTYLYNYDYMAKGEKKWNRTARERRVFFAPISFKNKVLAGPFIERLFRR